MPALSVTVLNYNYGCYLASCLEVILAQTFDDFEVIVIDDCSPDNSQEVIEPFKKDPRIRSIRHEKNVGYRGSLIEGTELLSRGEFLTVISADDVVRRKDAFEIQMRALRSRPDVSMCFSAVDRFSSETGEIYSVHHSFAGDRLLEPQDALRRFLTEEVWAMHSGTIIRAAAYRASGGYARDLLFALDTALWPLLCIEGPVAYCDTVLYGYRVHRNQMSRSLKSARETPGELFRLVERACSRAEQRGWKIGSLRDEADRYWVGRMLVVDAFLGLRRELLAEAWAALKLRPATMLSERRFWVALLRLALGERVFTAARGLLGRSKELSA